MVQGAFGLIHMPDGVRIEDVMVINHSYLYGIPEDPDILKDMRLDVDNMSYEELLEMEKQIVDVCRGGIDASQRNGAYISLDLLRAGAAAGGDNIQNSSGSSSPVIIHSGVAGYVIEENISPDGLPVDANSFNDHSRLGVALPTSSNLYQNPSEARQVDNFQRNLWTWNSSNSNAQPTGQHPFTLTSSAPVSVLVNSTVQPNVQVSNSSQALQHYWSRTNLSWVGPSSVSLDQTVNDPDILEDMRLDVDNMSYEELQELEEQIGDVCTGLSEETIMDLDIIDDMCLDADNMSYEEDYVDGEELDKLGCVHEFHFDCIKEWIVLNNSCPICKNLALVV
ncbi:Detected protein of unknown function [Hibiscus syriacus]|uniref:RING-type E3 ubiquitin transferase n=1 Tax=Hibiscus syriacus TaxID=106335 RepID=A0A6A3D2D7_HIBSY|nr:Detected protein of unknown function [Hibiscus syriacus]